MTVAARATSAEEELQQIVRRIVETYDPDRIILFGSHAYGAPRPDSDFDLLIIKETVEPSNKRWSTVRDALWTLPVRKSIEPIVVTRAELTERLKFGDQLFRKIVRQGRTLYDRNPFTEAQITGIIEGTEPMKPEESPIPGEWYEMAARDWGAAKVLFKDNDEMLVPAGTFLQQAVEKYLKGYLLSKGWQLVRTHDLSELLNGLVGYERDFADFKDACSQVTEFYLDNRYTVKPKTPVTRAALEKLFADAEALITRIKERAAPPPPVKD